MKVNLRRFVSAFVLCAVAVPTVFFAAPFARVSAQAFKQISAGEREDAYRFNNLGAARLEQFDHQAGAAAFRRALQANPQLTLARTNLAIALFNLQDLEAARHEAEIAAAAEPNSPQPLYILALIAKNQNRTDEAIALLKKVLTIDANDVGANVNLGQIYVAQRKFDEAIAAFRVALAAEPYNATAMYTLATALLRTNARAEGQQLMPRFQALRQSGAATNIGQNYLEQGRYAEALTSTGAESDLVDKTSPQIVFQNTDIGLPVLSGTERGLKNAAKRSSSEVPPRSSTFFDFDNDGDLDLAQTTVNPAAARLYRNDAGKFSDVTRAAASDLNKVFDAPVLGIVAGDFDNDNFSDLLVFGSVQPTLFRNNGQGNFKDVTVAAKIPKSSIVSKSAAFVDADHDGDLDIFLGGFAETNRTSDKFAANELLRNNGDGSFVAISEAAKINLPSRAVAVIPTDFDNRRDIDLLVLSRDSAPNLFRNLRDGSFRDVAAEVGLNHTAAWSCAAVGDFNKDTFVDFFFGKSGGIGTFAVSDGRGKFVLQDAPTGTENATASQFLDYDNDGLLDLLVATSKGLLIARNLGGEFAGATAEPFKQSASFADASEILSADLDADGDLDLLVDNRFLRNDGGSINNSEIVRLQGRVSNRTGIGAKIDLRAGSLAQKLETYSASPMPAPSEAHFGLGKREKPDAVRVIWTSGTVQAEIEFPEKAKNLTAKNFAPLKIEELDRKPSSCPYLYTWNGEKFEFITDFLGGGEMGNWKGAGAYHYPDSDEYIRITSDQLKPKNGRYEIRVTNELEEVLFLDHLKLIAVEHDANREVYPNEGLGIPTVGQKILYTTENARAPLSAIDSGGKSVLANIERLDRRFYESFKSLNIRGYAETHSLTLNLDDRKNFNGRTLLLLTGWTDYAFSSDNLAAAQSGKSLFPPQLQVKNRRAEWETVIDNIGISIGRPQTLVVDLTGKFLSDSREVRIVTNFKTFWDQIVVDSSEQTNVKTIELQTAQADLRERGFSEEIKYGEMLATNYDTVFKDGRWKSFSGIFTRTGAVKPLLNEVDDVFVISKTGDELVLSFDALPEPPKNKKYTFLLYADGYSKEMDINSGSPEQVLPLPFKGMTKYPYAADESFPMTEEKRRIYDEYTTRRVRGFLPRIETSLLK